MNFIDPELKIGSAAGNATALICFSHLRWDFVFQRPQHLMTRAANHYRVYFFEEPIFTGAGEARLNVRQSGKVTVLTPELPHGLGQRGDHDAQRALLDELIAREAIEHPVLWYYTPLSLTFSSHLEAGRVVYDCMDELSMFRNPPEGLMDWERRLLDRADVVFTGGQSLFEAKQGTHSNVHPFPSSVDVGHFRQARDIQSQPVDQAGIPTPRMGFIGVIDERFDTELLREVAAARPDWQLVMVGPVVKIDPATLPQASNIHYLGQKTYDELPAYLAGWDVALLPFALNDSTRFISPTKTPEYLAAGCAVVSTAIRDVVRPYGDKNLVRIARSAPQFVEAIALALAEAKSPTRLAAADAFLADLSWDGTWDSMSGLINAAINVADGEDTAPRSSVVTKGPGWNFDYVVVGAGFAGSVMAERLASQGGKRVLVIDRRPHIGGNAYDHHDETGILVHKYGPHIFHTNSDAVFAYLSQFTQWRPYEHRVLGSVDGKLVPVPINRTTINKLYGLNLSEAEAEAFLAARAEPVDRIVTSEDVVVSTVGRELYEKFFQGYTTKQWGVDPSQLDKSVTARIPVRTNDDDRYFTDQHQVMPLEGYTRMFERMLDHPNIRVMVGTEFSDIENKVNAAEGIVFTGPVDEYFDYRFGRLPYRSLQFRHVALDQERFQSVGVVNYPSRDVPYTRITEYKHLTGQTSERTSITYEFPSAEGDPYYPIPCPENQAMYKKYQALADATPNVYFVGRLATYRYYNMDQVVAQALSMYQKIEEKMTAAENANQSLGDFAS